MPAAHIRLDHDGIQEMLQSAPVIAAIAERAAKVEAVVTGHQSIRRHRMPVVRSAYVTDRAAESVTIAHPGGLAVQAKHGVLSRAPAAADLEYRADPTLTTQEAATDGPVS